MHKVLKIILFVLLFLFLLIAGSVVYLNTTPGEEFVRSRAEAYLKQKLKTEVRIGYLGYGLPKFIELHNVLLLDEQKDTLLSLKLLKADVAMLQLLHKELSVSELKLSGLNSHIYRGITDTNFNFSYIVAAFSTPGPPKPVTEKKTASAPFKVSVDQINLDDIRFRLDDDAGGTTLHLGLEHLALKMKETDLEAMLFHIKDLGVAGLKTDFSQGTSHLPTHKSTDTSKTKLQLIADRVQLDRIQFNYADKESNLLFGILLGSLNLQLNKFDLAHTLVDVKKLSVNNTSGLLSMGKQQKDTTTGGQTQNSKNTWQILADEVAFAGISFKMDDASTPPQPTGIDYSHLDLKGVAVNLHQLNYTADTISGDLKHLTAKEKSGIDLQELSMRFQYFDKGMVFKNIALITPHTILRNNFQMHYPSLASLSKNIASLDLNADFTRSVLGLEDLVLFAPEIKQQYFYQKNPRAQIRFDAKVTGHLNNMYIAHLYVLSLNGTEADLKGRLSGLPDPKKLDNNLNISKLKSGREALRDFVPDSLLQAIRIPDKFGIAGNVAGNLNDYKTDLTVESTDGNAYVKGTLATSPGKGREQYDMLVQTHEFNLGRILRQDSVMGKISAAITAKGTGFDPKKMTVVLNGAVGTAQLEKYNYHDILFNMNLTQGNGSVSLSSADSNLRAKLNGTLDLTGEYPGMEADILLDSIDFKALNLYTSDLRACGLMHLDFPSLNPDYPEGTFIWTKSVINAGGKRYFPDTISIVSKPDGQGGQHITAQLDLMKAAINGKIALTKIGPVIAERMNRHYSKGIPDSCKTMTGYTPSQLAICVRPDSPVPLPTDYSLTVNATLVDKPLLHALLPDLATMEPIVIAGNVTPKSLGLDIAIPELVYGTNTIENGLVTVKGTDSAFTYLVTADKIANSVLDLWFANIHGNIDQGSISTNVSLCDSLKKERFAIIGTLLTMGDSEVIQVQPGFKLNYEPWTVAQPNRIVLAPGGFYVNNFNITNNNQIIKAASDRPAIDAPLTVNISNFRLADITSLLSANDTLPVDGMMGGAFTMQTSNGATRVAGDLDIKDLTVMGDTLGNLNAKASIKDSKTIATAITLNGKGNEIDLTGEYYISSATANDFDMQLNVKALALHSFEGLTMKQIRQSSGLIKGNLRVTGKATAPLLNGSLKTDNLRTNISTINSTFKFPSETISFAGDKITFNNFTIVDSPDNKAIVNGTITTTDITNPVLNLTIKAKKWRAIHSTEKDNTMFYGDLVLNANLNVKGTATVPVADGSLDILKGTNLTVSPPESQPEIENSKGIVVFVNMKDTSRARTLANRKKKVATTRKSASGADVNVNINIDKTAKFSLILDQASGDFLTVQGDANLNASMAPNGTIGLNGNYELHQGSYQLNYNFIKRKFLIHDGSNIIFAGDPINATTLDITAVYEAAAPPFDLVEKQVTDPSQLNYYKQRLPFEVDLHMKGKVLKPDLTFDIQLPENKVYPLTTDQIELIQGKLSQVRQDTSELNKQVFALLILNRFVSEDPFNSGASSSVGFTALQSASTFIGEQLNKAANHFVKGVDFAVDLATTEDYTSGDLRQRTDLNLAASKQLMNDRLKITVGNDFELEGQQSTNQQSSYIPTNLSADYQLTEDGRYTLRAYRKAYDEGVLQGYITETGLNFIVSLDYDNFLHDMKKRKKQQTTKATDTLKTK